MQNSGYGSYGATGYYTSPPAAGAPAPAPAAGSYSAPYGSYAASASSDAYSSYSTNQPSYGDNKGQQPNYYSQPPANSGSAPSAVPPSTGYSSDTYGSSNYYGQSQPGSQSSAPPPAQPPSYGSYGGPPAPPSANSPSGQWQSGPPGGYGGPNAPPGGYSNYGNGMRSGPPGPPGGPPGFRGGHGGGRNGAGPGYKGNGAPGGFGPSSGPPESDTIFISGMPLDVTEEQLANHFGSIGIIKLDKNTKRNKIWIYRDKVTGDGKGEATLTYEDPHTAKSAISWFNGKEMPGTGKILSVDFAQRKTPMGGDFRGGRGGPPRGGPRGRGGPPGGPGGRDNGYGRQGDWRCPVPSCGNNNFAWRNECNRCKAPRPEGLEDEGGMPGFPPDRRGPPPDRRGGPGMGGPPGMGGDRRRGGGPPFGGPPGDRPPRGGPGDRGPRGRFDGPPRGRGRGGPGPMRGGPMGDYGDRRPKPY